MLQLLGLLVAVAGTPEARPLILEHCIEKADSSAPYCFLEVITPQQVKLIAQVRDLPSLMNTPIAVPDPKASELRKIARLRLRIAPVTDAAYFENRRRSLGGYLYQPHKLRDPDHLNDWIQTFGFGEPPSAAQQNYPSLANPFLMECSNRCAAGVIAGVISGGMAGAHYGKDLGLTLGAAYPGIGTVAGPVGGMIIGGLFGAFAGGLGAYSTLATDDTPRQRAEEPKPHPQPASPGDDSAPPVAGNDDTQNSDGQDEVPRKDDTGESTTSNTKAPAAKESQQDDSTPNPEESDGKLPDGFTHLMSRLHQFHLVKHQLVHWNNKTPSTPVVRGKAKVERPRPHLIDLLILHDQVQQAVRFADHRININVRPGQNTLVNPGHGGR